MEGGSLEFLKRLFGRKTRTRPSTIKFNAPDSSSTSTTRVLSVFLMGSEPDTGELNRVAELFAGRHSDVYQSSEVIQFTGTGGAAIEITIAAVDDSEYQRLLSELQDMLVQHGLMEK